MALPAFRDDGWLPEGNHATTWEEIIAVFGGQPGSVRHQVLIRLLYWRDRLRAEGMSGRLILDGSFISQKAEPGDFDCLFIYDTATEKRMEEDEEARELTNYVRCKEQGYGDVFVFAEEAVREFPQFCRTDGFNFDKVTKKPKGVVEVQI